jgi:hypothetical protein
MRWFEKAGRGRPSRPLVMVVGLQKSGTSLLMRLLIRSGLYANPLSWEGREYWGDDPPFTPAAYPSGTLYQRYGGERGHELGADDATDDVVRHLREGLPKLDGDVPGIVLKNPYNTVRLPWVRAIFPRLHVVAIVRHPVPNVYSLHKKYVPHELTTWVPDDGWWGLKPAGWRELVRDDKVVQSALQWQRTHETLVRDLSLVDTVVPYQELCREPARVVEGIAKATLGEAPELEFEPIEAQDSEPLTGGPMESANRAVRRTGSFDIRKAERHPDRLPPFTDAQRAAVLEACEEVAGKLGLAERTAPISQA